MTTGTRIRKAAVVDLFCGAGGLAHGFKLEGFRVRAGVDMDPECEFPFSTNNAARFVCKDVQAITAEELNDLYGDSRIRVLVGCAPCQPFSTYTQSRADPQWTLVDAFADIILSAKPDVVSMENVPRLEAYQRGTLFKRFVGKLQGAGYTVGHRVVYLPDYGLPQRRSRLVLMASLHGPVPLEEPVPDRSNSQTVMDAIGHLPALKAGEANTDDRLHVASSLTAKNIQRLRASKPGGTWLDWDEHLRAPCHRRSEGAGYGAVYGRMLPDAPSPTITTQFYNFGSGRFGHPIQDRALSLREGALLQSFPGDYQFLDPQRPLNVRSIGRLIGNAVPVTLARVIARSIGSHIDRFNWEDART